MRPTLIVKPFPHVKPERLRERKAVTIIAGFRCREGIVVCADTQETSGPSKRDVPKLRFEQRGILTEAPLAVAFCGSGYGPLIDKLVDEAWKAAQAVESLNDVCGEIEQTVKSLYREYGEIYQAGECPTAELIYGVRTKEGSKLFSANGAIVNERTDYYSSGAGYYMADFLASRMYHRQYLSLRQCVILAAYILFQAKEHVDGCGGESHIAILRDKGVSGNVDPKRVEAMTDLLQMADINLGSALLEVADLETDMPAFRKNMKLLMDSLDSTREYKRNDREMELQRWKEVATALGGGEPEETDEFGLPLH
jgi:20S proteasome alpha/beta subunit